MIASAHLLLAGAMIGVACESPGDGWPFWAAIACAAFNFGMFVYRMPDPMESLD